MSKYIVLRTPFNGQIFNKKPYKHSLTWYQKLNNLKNICVDNRLETVDISMFSRLVFVILGKKKKSHGALYFNCFYHCYHHYRKCSYGKITGQVWVQSQPNSHSFTPSFSLKSCLHKTIPNQQKHINISWTEASHILHSSAMSERRRQHSDV